ncbi:MAG: hypothetical protein K1060chlam5_00182 [Candidatus Anoxychlamydiales bacterium]|nr:hypothetical protein [Candidatus Anoxychlamydiales bacterium]
MKKNIILSISILSFLFSIFFFSLNKNKEDTVYFFAGNFKRLFNENNDGFYNLAHIIESYGYKVKETRSFKNLKNCKYIVVFDIHDKKLKRIKRLNRKKLILFTWEPPTAVEKNYDHKIHKYFSKVYTTVDTLVDNKKFFKFHYPSMQPFIHSNIDYEKKKLLCTIIGNHTSTYKYENYTERLKSINFFEDFASKDLDFFGRGWNKKDFKTYKGAVKDKSILANYKFSLCYENTTNIKGYISEKIFDSLAYGCIPIYLGADNIQDYIPKNCFIDKRDFKSYSELYTYLKTMPKEKYFEYLLNIQTFLKSDNAMLFTPKNLIANFLEALELENQKK